MSIFSRISVLGGKKTPIENDIEQSIVRLIIGLIILIYILWPLMGANEQTNNAVNLTSIIPIFLFYSLCVFIIAYYAASETVRKYLRIATIVGDVTFLTASQVLSPFQAYPLVPIYCWIIMGNGFRYGTHTLLLATAISTVGFIMSLIGSQYWQENMAMGYSLFIFSIVLALYGYSLLARAQQARADAEKADNSKSQFLANMSHELRTPLNAVLGLSQLLADTKLDESQRDFVNTINSSGNLLLNVINDILDYSKLDAYQVKLEHEPLQIRELANEIMRILLPEAQKKGLMLTTNISDNVPSVVLGDSFRMQQILINLLNNSIKFTNDGYISLNINLDSMQSGVANITFIIKDSGIGMDKETCSRIFEPFEQATQSTSRQYGGTGLGTTIAKNLVDAMSGIINVSSEVSVGTTFTICIGFDLAQLNTIAPLPLEDISQRTPSYDNHTAHVLVAEDNMTNQMVIKQILNAQGYTCMVVDNGDDALDELFTDKYDVAILDVSMPPKVGGGIEDGLQVARFYNFSTRPNHVPLIMLSANTSETMMDACEHAGVYTYLSKPINQAELCKKIYESIHHSNVNKGGVAVVSEDISLFNSANLDDLFPDKNDIKVLDTLLTTYRNDNDCLLEVIKQDVSNNQYESLSKRAHNMKGAALNIGAMRLARYAAKLIAGAECHSTKQINSAVDAIIGTLPDTHSAIKQYLESRTHTGTNN